MDTGAQTRDRTGTGTILRRIREEGDDAAWSRFVRRYERVIRGYAVGAGLDPKHAQDLTQTVLLELIGLLPTFEPDNERGGFRALLRTIVRRRVIDHFRKARRESNAAEAHARPEDFDTGGDLFERVWRSELYRAAEDAVRRRTNPIDFQAFELIAGAKVPGGQVARLLGITKASAYKAKSRVAAEIREELTQLDEEAR